MSRYGPDSPYPDISTVMSLGFTSRRSADSNPAIRSLDHRPSVGEESDLQPLLREANQILVADHGTESGEPLLELREIDLGVTGGRDLHRVASAQSRGEVHLFFGEEAVVPLHADIALGIPLDRQRAVLVAPKVEGDKAEVNGVSIIHQHLQGLRSLHRGNGSHHGTDDACSVTLNFTANIVTTIPLLIIFSRGF